MHVSDLQLETVWAGSAEGLFVGNIGPDELDWCK